MSRKLKLHAWNVHKYIATEKTTLKNKIEILTKTLIVNVIKY